MGRVFCVIRVGEPALSGCGKPTLIGPHARFYPRRRGAARAIMGQSRHVRSTHVADRTQHSISGTAPGHSPSSQVGIPQPLTKQRPAIGQHVRIEQLGGRHVVEPGKGHTVRHSTREPLPHNQGVHDWGLLARRTGHAQRGSATTLQEARRPASAHPTSFQAGRTDSRPTSRVRTNDVRPTTDAGERPPTDPCILQGVRRNQSA